MNQPTLAVVLKGYPRLSETFIAQEIRNLERAGFKIVVYSLRHPTDPKTHPIHDEIQARVVYLPEYLYQELGRVVRGWLRVRRLPGYASAARLFWQDFRHDLTANRIRRFGQALVLAAELADNTPALYAHFLHTPASVTFYAAMIRGLPWACSAHAKDIYTTPNWEIRSKLDHCQWLTTCTRNNHFHLRKFCSEPEKVQLNYHGVDLERFRFAETTYSERDGSAETDPVVLLSVGRAVEKKGYAALLDALENVNKTLFWRLIHVGGGPLLSELRNQAHSLGIAERIEWLGPQPQQTVIEQYRRADLFVLNSCVDRFGDRDGLPNVMVEAQSQGLPVIGTNISGIPELIENDHNGILVESGVQAELVESLELLITRPDLRKRHGEAGRIKVSQEFDMQSSFSRLGQQLSQLAQGWQPADR